MACLVFVPWTPITSSAHGISARHTAQNQSEWDWREKQKGFIILFKKNVYFAWPYYPLKSLSRKGDLMICQTNSQNSIVETSAHITTQTVLVPCQISRNHSWLHSRRFILQATHSEGEVWSDWDVSSKAKFAFVLVFCFYFMHCFVLCWVLASWVRIRQVQLANNDAWNKRGIKTRGQRSRTHTFSKLWSFYRWVAWT